MKNTMWIKRGVIFLLFLSWSTLQGQEWSREIEISPGDTPDMDIDPVTGNIFVLSMNEGVTYTILSPAGVILKQEVVSVTGADKDMGGDRFGAAIAVDNQGYPHICFREYYRTSADGTPLFTTYYVKKTASGWSQRITLWERVRRGYMIRIDVDENNVAHIAQGYVFDDDNSIWGRLKYFRIRNNVVEKSMILGDDKNYVYRGDDRLEIEAYKGGKIHIVSGVPNPKGNIYHFYSNDNGDTFDAGNDIHDTSAYGRNGSPDLQMDNSGIAHVCYGTSQDSNRNGKPSIHYVSINGDKVTKDVIATLEDAVVDWRVGMGLGSVACSDDGQTIVMAYTRDDGGSLSATISKDAGNTWSPPVELAAASGSNEGRNKQLVRGHGVNFYLVYPASSKIYFRSLSMSTNQSPLADAGGPYTGNEGSSITFNSSNSFDPDGQIVLYEWDWQNDGTYDMTTTQPMIQYTYQDNFSGQVKVRIQDNAGATATDLANIIVNNVPPTANANGPYVGEKNADVFLSGTATDPGALDVPFLTFAWDLNDDGIYEANGKNVTARFATGGVHIVRLKVSDDDGGMDIDSTTVTIPNLPPIVSSIPSQQISRGQTFAPIQLDFFVRDPDNQDQEIRWEALGQVNLTILITNRVAYPSIKDPNWIGSESIIFVATDPGNLKDSTVTSFTVLDVHNPPVLSAIPSQTKNEGIQFEPINLDAYVNDPDNQHNDLIWNVTGNIDLQLNWSGHILSILWPNADWFGSERLTFIVTDPGGLADTTAATFTINNVNDPPVISGLTGQTIRVNEQFLPIYLDNYVQDIDHADNQLIWSYTGNSAIQISINPSRIATLTYPGGGWKGSESITFEVSDGSLSDQETVTFTVLANNQPPVVGAIPSQTIGEGQTFQEIFLDGFVSDPDHRDDEIGWTLSGYNELVVQLINRTVSIAVPDSEWAGSETILFTATDPTGLSSTTTATFTVIAINDPPKFSPLPAYSISEDDTLKLNIDILKTYVSDPDNEPGDFHFEVTNLSNMNWSMHAGSNSLYLFAKKPDWYGIEIATIRVSDGSGGSDWQLLQITVQPVSDPPAAFSVIAPNNYTFTSTQRSITFTWHRSYDPDNLGGIKYELSLSILSDFSHVFDSYLNLSDTTYLYQPAQALFDGTYYWRIRAYSANGLYRYSSVGVFSINQTAVSDDAEGPVPREYVLVQNYPNPFNPATRIAYHMPERAFVEICIYNSVGQMVRKLESIERPAGIYEIEWDGLDDYGQPMSSGHYIYQLRANGHHLVRKMLLLH